MDLERFKILMAMDANYMPPEYDGDIFHYTSPVGFQSILFGDINDVVIWASRYDCLNDMSEGKVAEEVLHEVAKDLFTQKVISKEIYDFYCSVKPAHTIPLYREVEGDLKFTRPECNRYVCSFSKNSDSLAMWNYYSKGSKYEGFNIGFYSKGVKDTLSNTLRGVEAMSHIYPVIYDINEQKELIRPTLLRLKEYYSKENLPQLRAIISTRLLEWALVFKKGFFQHEEEVRIIIDIAKKEKSIPVSYRMTAGYTIPYIKLKLDQDDVSSVTIGPLQGGDAQAKQQVEVMKEMLLNNRFSLARVEHSNVPVRY